MRERQNDRVSLSRTSHAVALTSAPTNAKPPPPSHRRQRSTPDNQSQTSNGRARRCMLDKTTELGCCRRGCFGGGRRNGGLIRWPKERRRPKNITRRLVIDREKKSVRSAYNSKPNTIREPCPTECSALPADCVP